jgi:hypothetical protein
LVNSDPGFLRARSVTTQSALALIVDHHGRAHWGHPITRVMTGQDSGSTLIVPVPRPGWYAIQAVGMAASLPFADKSPVPSLERLP